MYVWDEKQREANLVKYRLDFADAAMVYEHPDKFTRRSVGNGEVRNADVAVIEVSGTCLTLVYVERGGDTRIISCRNSSRSEREILAESRQ